MKNSFLITLVFILLTTSLFSKESSSAGTEFWVGIPYVAREVSEPIRGQYPVTIWISSNVDTRATVSDEETGTLLNVKIRANQITQVPCGDILMNKESEVAKNNALHIVSDDPITVTVYISYRWTGEAFTVIPTAFSGTEYYTLNLYQDQLKQDGDYKSPQILIISNEDNNKITYMPTTETVKKVKKGAIGTVNLMKGQTFLILGSVKPGQSQDNSTDLTGTYIQSSKPIGVVSGHTKGAFPRYQYTFLGMSGGFMRNALLESMPPLEALGTQYISAPLKYGDRPRGKIQDDVGDLIRFVATEDNTIISQMRKDGASLMQISPVMKKQQFYDIVNQDAPAFYSSNKKVLVGQYGKTWWLNSVTPQTKPSDDEPQAPSRNGQGMLLVLTPKDHWTNYASWRSPESIDDYIYVTFEAKNLDYLYIGSPGNNPQKFSAKFGNSIKYIDGTAYAYITEAISSGDYYIFGDYVDFEKTDKATFAAYIYGNWDRAMDGFAYGYPVGYNYFLNIKDSISVADSNVCSFHALRVETYPKNNDSISIYRINPKISDNFEITFDSNYKPGLSKNTTLHMIAIDKMKEAHAEIEFVTNSGTSVTKQYTYKPQILNTATDLIDFGFLKEKDTVCSKYFTIKNNGDTTAIINKLKSKKGVEFMINENSQTYPITYPIIIQKDDSVTVEVCATAPVQVGGTVWDSVVAETSCYDTPLCKVQYKMGEVIVVVTDADWGSVKVGNIVSKNVDILNQGNLDAKITGMNWPQADKADFFKVEGFNFKDSVYHGNLIDTITIKPTEKYQFTVYYKPDRIGIRQTRATFTMNTNRSKLYSDWVGSGITSIEDNIVLNADLSPNPASDIIEISVGANGRSSVQSEIKIYNVFGQILTTPSLRDTPPWKGGEKVKIDVSGLAPGMYFVRIGDRFGKFIKI